MRGRVEGERGHDELYFFDDGDAASVRAAYEAARAFLRLVRMGVARLSVFRRTMRVAAVAYEAVEVGENFSMPQAAA